MGLRENIPEGHLDSAVGLDQLTIGGARASLEFDTEGIGSARARPSRNGAITSRIASRTLSLPALELSHDAG